MFQCIRDVIKGKNIDVFSFAIFIFRSFADSFIIYNIQDCTKTLETCSQGCFIVTKVVISTQQNWLVSELYSLKDNKIYFMYILYCIVHVLRLRGPI